MLPVVPGVFLFDGPVVRPRAPLVRWGTAPTRLGGWLAPSGGTGGVAPAGRARWRLSRCTTDARVGRTGGKRRSPASSGRPVSQGLEVPPVPGGYLDATVDGFVGHVIGSAPHEIRCEREAGDVAHAFLVDRDPEHPGLFDLVRVDPQRDGVLGAGAHAVTDPVIQVRQQGGREVFGEGVLGGHEDVDANGAGTGQRSSPTPGSRPCCRSFRGLRR